ncbi:MAG TPA: type II toxin-antitoxin system mRNA interferase toxin, RelE/StbE family [Balneola sp.]|jgi:mRNA interferase RelE/StbE|nr:type II toxin-antitoxin system mRNA interferase toxin, RelE/StbE family [Balneola sp.]MAO77428.1 type II toxin-antitoxin system mRNA interferase toxin, RelE/StbE family [Balneola sp.]MBF65386.1 type II toxin-antitoxin system mRNA interferase toxin, RelE/StbE family [Balneola sp.]HAH52324.1 type II toxin-antitoxin system mRNA interferase toxin, RelE/StbE family [Balneola sp.]HAW80954.1 type II toxin-antitoxin system mRNA interferase toxin, RelE/StbE family [Balneola sp.]|tara:strand:- start:3026 stop:3298 length:273 start_codon:yes stop_codon:yes gene_type:complete
MIWKVEFDDRARKELRKLDKQTQDRILKWLRTNLATEEDPRRTGKSLKGRMKGLWRYRVGDYRIVSQIQDEQILILIIRIGHRRDVYDKK